METYKTITVYKWYSEESISTYVVSKKVGKDQEAIQSGTTPYPGYHMGK